MYEGSGTSDRRFLHADERGTIVAVTNSSGTTLSVNTYDEYGKPGSSNTGRFQYTGQAYLPELGVYYYKARMYASGLGRFMQTDPIGYGDGMNRYAAMGDDPVNHGDPSGLCRDENGNWYEPPTGSHICGNEVTDNGISGQLSGFSSAGPGGHGGPTVGEAYQAANNLFGGAGSAAINAAADYFLGRGTLAQVSVNLPRPIGFIVAGGPYNINSGPVDTYYYQLVGDDGRPIYSDNFSAHETVIPIVGPVGLTTPGYVQMPRGLMGDYVGINFPA